MYDDQPLEGPFGQTVFRHLVAKELEKQLHEPRKSEERRNAIASRHRVDGIALVDGRFVHQRVVFHPVVPLVYFHAIVLVGRHGHRKHLEIGVYAFIDFLHLQHSRVHVAEHHIVAGEDFLQRLVFR